MKESLAFFFTETNMEQFKKLGILGSLLSSISEHKFEKPTEIQEKTIPIVLGGKDVIAGAATGSGKTLAFGAGILQNCEKKGMIQALVLTPTRELAGQIAKSLKIFAKYKPLEIVEVYGGVAMGPQVTALRKADVVIGTPGRILDHLEHKTIALNNIKILVLDEADRMLDMGFIDDVDRIIRNCPKRRQTLMFSATISQDVVHLSKKYMDNPVEVASENYVDPSKLMQTFYDVPNNLKFSLLVHLLRQEHSGLVMVFCNTQRNTDIVARNLQRQGINAVAIHGGLSQDKRTRIMESFHSRKVYVLVCTDVAARGLDIKNVSHVYNYDLPNEAIQYVHRIGRTARAGKEGKAISILASRDYNNFSNIVERTGINITKENLPYIEQVPIDLGARQRGFHRNQGEKRFSYGKSIRWQNRGRSSLSSNRHKFKQRRY